ncbi:MAG: metal-binding protein, partial [Lachnospiraceae bacterium]|nr:metal-binding protein [Lachnospiraceae bacterium]
GNHKYIEVNGTKIKECTDCIFPHQAENYDTIIKFLTTK